MYFEIDETTFNELDDDIKGKLKPYEPEDVTGLKSKANELLAEVKETKTRMAEAEAEKAAAQAELKKVRQSSQGQHSEEYKAELEDAKSRLSAANEALERMQQDRIAERVNGEAARIAATLTKDTGKATILTQQIKARLAYEDDSYKVLDASGKPTISTVDELTGEIRGNFPFLVDGSQASGGGATGSSGGAGKTTQMSRTDFNQLTPDKQMEFTKSGGNLTDD